MIAVPGVIATAYGWLKRAALAIAPIALRLALATPFFRSGLTRWDGFLSLSPATTYLFEEEFKLHILGAQYAFPWPDVIAHIVATAEIALPALLILGLATRLSALGLLFMTAVIQLVQPDGWANFHIHWAAEAIAIVAIGSGSLSIDGALGRWRRRVAIPQGNP
jgi:putative oxidoreductase